MGYSPRGRKESDTTEQPHLVQFRLRSVQFSRSFVSDSCDSVDCSLPGFYTHGILQARILEWFTISFPRGSSRPRDRTWVSRVGDRCFNL